MIRLKRSVATRRARSAAATLGIGLLGTILLGNAAMAKRVLAAEMDDAAPPLSTALPAGPSVSLPLPQPMSLPMSLPAADAQVPISAADFSRPIFAGDQADDTAAFTDGATGNQPFGSSAWFGGHSLGDAPQDQAGNAPGNAPAGDARPGDGAASGTGGTTGGAVLGDRLFGLRPASGFGGDAAPTDLSRPDLSRPALAQPRLISGSAGGGGQPVMSPADIAAQLIPGRPDQLELLADLRLPLAMGEPATFTGSRFAGADADAAGAAIAADGPNAAAGGSSGGAIIARVPLPAALPLFGGALLALALVNWRGRRRARADRTARYRSAAT
ncbi:MAG TPA: hypothetical protein VND94_09730 [Terriglobia bacterium]|nr:hypothetical protein [Terriglobia bacterium]